MKRPERSRTHETYRDYFPQNAALWSWRDVFDFFVVKRAPQSHNARMARLALWWFVDRMPCMREVEA